jgi:hypothetical protein
VTLHHHPLRPLLAQETPKPFLFLFFFILFFLLQLLKMSSYKEEKEAFVSNLHGTSMGEVALVALTIPVLPWATATPPPRWFSYSFIYLFWWVGALQVTYLLHSVVVSLCSRSAPELGAPLRFAVDFVCLVLPMLATFTMPHTVPLVFAGVLLLCALLDAYSRWYSSLTL